jgi:hypothetical protein
MRLALTKDKNIGLTTAAVLFALVALVHLCRLFTHFSVAVAGCEIPLAVSAVSFIVLASLSAWLWTMRS